MSRINGEKARAAIQRKRRTAQREKDAVTLAALKSGAVTPKAPKAAKAPKASASDAAASE